jgi:hypothetical protein
MIRAGADVDQLRQGQDRQRGMGCGEASPEQLQIELAGNDHGERRREGQKEHDLDAVAHDALERRAVATGVELRHEGSKRRDQGAQQHAQQVGVAACDVENSGGLRPSQPSQEDDIDLPVDRGQNAEEAKGKAGCGPMPGIKLIADRRTRLRLPPRLPRQNSRDRKRRRCAGHGEQDDVVGVDGTAPGPPCPE